jgi:predicted dehydrogenase
MNDRVRVGMVGLGVISRTHLEVLADLERTSLEFTVDPNVEEPTEFRGSEVPHYRNLSAALDRHQPDLVVVATPTDTHAELTACALTDSTARVLVEKPLVHDLDTLARLRSLDETAAVHERVFTAHHFAFSPEVLWAARQIADHPEWGPVTGITSAFFDPYILLGDKAFASYGSSWMDSGVNQLSVLARFVELEALTGARQLDDAASAWCMVEYSSRGTTGTARLRTSWLTGSSSKKTVLSFDRTGVEIWVDHTAMTGFAAHADELLATRTDDGQTPRKVAHYRPLYESLLSTRPDDVLSFDAATTITRIHHSADSGSS